MVIQFWMLGGNVLGLKTQSQMSERDIRNPGGRGSRRAGNCVKTWLGRSLALPKINFLDNSRTRSPLHDFLGQALLKLLISHFDPDFLSRFISDQSAVQQVHRSWRRILLVSFFCGDAFAV